MTQYDKVIFVPDDEYGHYQVKGDKDVQLKSQKYSPHFNAIVVSIKELKEMWESAHEDGYKEGLYGSDWNFFEKYMQSKGIVL